MAYKPTILQVKDPNTSQWIPIPAITGGDGRSAYQVAVDNGYTGTEAQWIESLKGENGVSIQNISGNADGSWTITYTNGTSETISNGAYISLVNELQRAKHTTMAVEITDDGFGGYNSSVNDNDINNHRNAGGVVFCYYHNSANNVTYTYWYSNMEPDRKPTFLRTYIDEAGKVKQVLISVDNAKKATVVFRTASVPIDPTLTQPNQAADAKAVGDALNKKADVEDEWELIDTATITSDNDDYLLNIQTGLKSAKMYVQTPDRDDALRILFFYLNDPAESYVNALYWHTQYGKYAIMQCYPEGREYTTLNGSGDTEYHYNKLAMGGQIMKGFDPSQYSISKIKSYGGLLAGTKIEVRGVRAK